MNRKAIILIAGVIAAGVVVFVLTSSPGSQSGTTPRSAWTVSFTATGAAVPTVIYTLPASNTVASPATNPPAK